MSSTATDTCKIQTPYVSDAVYAILLQRQHVHYYNANTQNSLVSSGTSLYLKTALVTYCVWNDGKEISMI